MGHVDVQQVEFTLPDGRPLLGQITFRVGEGARTALIGPNGTGKTTLLRIVSGDLKAHAGAVTHTGGLGVMCQFIGQVHDDSTVRDLLVSVAPRKIGEAAAAIDVGERAVIAIDDERAQMTYAQALADWTDVGGYQYEVLWDVCTTAALGVPYERAQLRGVSSLSGGEQKRLVLEALLRGPEEVLVLDEPDNYLDVPGKRWLEDRLVASTKTVLFVSHDRELLSRVATRVVTATPSSAASHSPACMTSPHQGAGRDRRRRSPPRGATGWDREKRRHMTGRPAKSCPTGSTGSSERRSPASSSASRIKCSTPTITHFNRSSGRRPR